MRQRDSRFSTNCVDSMVSLPTETGIRRAVGKWTSTALFASISLLSPLAIAATPGAVSGAASVVKGATGAETGTSLDATKAILEKARQKLDSKKNEAHVLMKIVEPGGEVKTREMDIAILQTANGSKAMVKMTAPVDSKGTAMLAVVENGEQQQWLYLPSSKQVRRIASVNKSSGILGSELTAEDMNPDALKDAEIKSISNDGKVAVIRLTPKAGTSDYSYAQTTFDLNDDLPKKTEFFKADVVQKTIEFQDYKTLPGGIARAQKIHIVNPIKNRATDIELSNIKATAKLSDSDFTPQALKASW